MKYLAYVIMLVASLSVLAAPALAQEPNYDRINDIAEDLSCPTCTGINLADCRTQTCEQWRDKIGDLVDEGYSDEEVLTYFATRYGDHVLQEPPRRGFALALWVLPVLALLAGGGWLLYTMRGWTGPPAEEEAVLRSSARLGEAPPDEYLDQVDKDLGIGEV